MQAAERTRVDCGAWGVVTGKYWTTVVYSCYTMVFFLTTRKTAHKDDTGVSRSKNIEEKFWFKCQMDGSMADGACHKAADRSKDDAVYEYGRQ